MRSQAYVLKKKRECAFNKKRLSNWCSFTSLPPFFVFQRAEPNYCIKDQQHKEKWGDLNYITLIQTKNYIQSMYNIVDLHDVGGLNLCSISIEETPWGLCLLIDSRLTNTIHTAQSSTSPSLQTSGTISPYWWILLSLITFLSECYPRCCHVSIWSD